MATSASSSLFIRLANVWRLLSLRSDVDNIILELLGHFSLEKIYAEGDKETYQHLVMILIAQLNTIFFIQRLSLPSEHQQAGWYLGHIVSWEVTFRSVEFVLQIVVEGRESLWDVDHLRDKYLAEMILSALRVLILHPKAPANHRAKDRRERYARLHRSLERVYDSYPGPKSFLLMVCKGATDSLRTEANSLALPARLRYELPNLASELYPLPECISSHSISMIVAQNGYPEDWLAQFLALRDVSHFVIGASIQYTVNRETRNFHLQSSSARSRNAVFNAVESLRLPSHISKMEAMSTFSDIFRIVLPDTLQLSRRDSADSRTDESEMDALDALYAKLTDRQVVHRVSDLELVHGVSEIVRSIGLLDDPTSQSRSAQPRIFALNCNSCHVAGDSQLKSLENVTIPPNLGDSGEYALPENTKCVHCGESITMLREIPIVRHTWDLLKPLEANADTINVERHLPTQFHLGPPKLDPGCQPFRPSYGNILSAGSGAISPMSPANTDMLLPSNLPPVRPNGSIPSDPSRSTQPSSFIPSSPGFYQSFNSLVTEFSRSDCHPSSPESTVEVPLPLFSKPALAIDPHQVVRQGTANSAVTSQSGAPSKKRMAPPAVPLEKSKSRLWTKLSGGSRKEPQTPILDTSSLSSTSIESQRLDEIPLRSLKSSQKISARGRGARNINVCLSRNSTYALFWTQSTIHLWDAGTSPSSIRREIATDGNCVIAAVTSMHLAYMIGTRDHKLTLRIMNLREPSASVVEYQMSSSMWCKSIAICPRGNYVVVGFESSIVRFFRTTSSEPPREDHLYVTNSKESRDHPAVDSLSFSHDGSVILASTRSPKSGTIQLFIWRFPFTHFQELPNCRYHVPLHECEDNGLTSAIYRSGSRGEEDLVCMTTWTQSGSPLLVQPQDGHRCDIRNDTSSRPGKLGTRIQCAAFSPTGRDLALVNGKGHLYQVSGLKSNPMDVRRIATSRELTARSDSFDMSFMTLPDEEAIVLAWVDSSKGVGFIKKIPVTYHQADSTPVTLGLTHPYTTTPSRAELQGDDSMPLRQLAEMTVNEEPGAIIDTKTSHKKGFEEPSEIHPAFRTT